MTTTLNASTAGAGGFIATSDNSGILALQTAGTTKLTIDSTGAYGHVISGTAVASTSGTSIDFTSIPSWVKRITVMLSGVSTSGTSVILLQLGISSGVEITGYTAGSYNETGGTGSTSTAGFSVNPVSVAASAYNGAITISAMGSNIFVATGLVYRSGTAGAAYMAGTKKLAGTLDRIRITTVNGTDTFDAGSVNILYE